MHIERNPSEDSQHASADNMNVITLTGDSCQLHPHFTRLTPPRLRSHRTAKKSSSRPAYLGTSLRLPSPSSTSPSPLTNERPASLLRWHTRTFIGPRIGVRLSVSLQRLNKQKKARIDALLRNHKDGSGGLRTDLQRIDQTTKSVSLLKITSSIQPQACGGAERDPVNTLLLRKTERQSAISSRQICSGTSARTIAARFLA